MADGLFDVRHSEKRHGLLHVRFGLRLRFHFILSAVLIVGSLQPIQRFRIHFIARGETYMELHGLMNLRGLQASAGLLSIEPEAEVYAVLRRGLHPRESPARRDERDISLARLDGDLAEPRGGVDDRGATRPQRGPARVLS